MWRIGYAARLVWVNVRWLATAAGYWIRPYDGLADARRWRWQPAQRCGGVHICLTGKHTQ